MLTEEDCRLILFSIIEPGDNFWTNEVHNLGAQVVLDLLLSKKYYQQSKQFLEISNLATQANLSKLHKSLDSVNASFISPRDIDWPAGLNDLSNPPIGLVIQGDRQVLEDINHSISIVGSRKPTNYGIEVTKKLILKAMQAKYLVVSGGAVGIDTTAHISCLSFAGKTVAVLAGGFSQPYPMENRRLFSEIAKTGLLISEVLPSISSRPNRFLIRNRLIAALSCATIVVEAEFVSGSIRTAREAAEIFRPVFAIPGPINSELSQGCHRLISERIADIATSFEEILELITPIQIR